MSFYCFFSGLLLRIRLWNSIEDPHFPYGETNYYSHAETNFFSKVYRGFSHYILLSLQYAREKEQELIERQQLQEIY